MCVGSGLVMDINDLIESIKAKIPNSEVRLTI